jgi:hypothetical protein
MQTKITDFSGGLTDSPFSSPENCAAAMDNWMIQKDKSMEVAPGVEIFSVTSGRLSTNARVSLIRKMSDGNFLAFSNKKAFKITSSAITELAGPAGDPCFNTGDANSIVTGEFFNDQFYATSDALPNPVKIWIDAGTWKLVQAGLPRPASTPTATSAAGSNAWVYAFVYSYTYTVNGVTFEDQGPPVYLTKTSMTNPVSIASIPVLANASGSHYDTTNIKVKIYRTLNAGTIYYYVGQVNNGTTDYSDTSSDATILAAGVTLYVNGGVLDNDAPPSSTFVFEANDTYYWGNVIQSTAEKPFRLIQSVTNDPDSAPAENLVDFKAELKGGGSVGRSPVVFTESQVVRLDGILDELGRGNIFKEVLSHTVGGVNHNSIVKGNDGIYWAGNDCFYFTNGYTKPHKLAKLSVDERGNVISKIDGIYKQITDTDEQKSRIQGCYDSRNNRVYWTVQEEESDNDKIYVYEVGHDAFTTLSFASGILPTAIIMDGEDLILGDSNGYLFRMSDSYYTVPVVDTAAAVTLWSEAPIMHSWKSTHLTMGDATVSKWITKVNAQGNPETNCTISMRSYTNGEPEYKELFPFKVNVGLTWDDAEFTWGDESFTWNRTSVMNQTRSFPRGRLRARQRQLELTNTYYTIQQSTENTASYVTTNPVAGTATLVTPASYSFGLNTEGYNLVINDVEYEITAGTADTLTVSGALPAAGNYAWQIKGYGKGQRPHVRGISIDWEPMSDAGTFWRGSSEA